MSALISLQAIAQATDSDIHVDDYDQQVTLDTRDGKYTIGNALDGNGAPYFKNQGDVHGGQTVYIGQYDMMGANGWQHVSAPASRLIDSFGSVVRGNFRNMK